MRTAASMLVLMGVLLSANPRAQAAEKDRSFETSTRSGDGRPAPGRTPAPGARVVVDSKVITKLISDINAAARTDKRRMLSIIVINTNVAATTLEQQKARTGLSLGDIYVAHALSLATRKKFDAIVALKTSGQSWAQIARSHNVSLQGSAEMLKEMMKNS